MNFKEIFTEAKTTFDLGDGIKIQDTGEEFEISVPDKKDKYGSIMTYNNTFYDDLDDAKEFTDAYFDDIVDYAQSTPSKSTTKELKKWILNILKGTM